MFVLITISDLDLTDMRPDFPELSNKSPTLFLRSNHLHWSEIRTSFKFTFEFALD